MWIPQWIKRVEETLHAEFRAIQQVLKEQTSAIEAASSDSQARENKERPLRVATHRVQLHEAKEASRYRKRGHWNQVILNVLTFLAVAGAWGYAAITFCTLQQLRQQSDIQREAMEKSERAWLSVWITNDLYEIGKPMHLRIHIKNTGRTFAKECIFKRSYAIVKRDAFPSQAGWTNDKTIKVGLISPDGVWENNVKSTEKLRADEVNELNSTETVYVKGRIDFNDIFPDSKRHWITFCYFGSGRDWIACQAGNDIDPN